MTKAKQKAIKAALLACDRDRTTWDRIHRKANAAIFERIYAIQSECSHTSEFMRFHSDPAGGSDSWYECGLCGANVTRRERSKKP